LICCPIVTPADLLEGLLKLSVWAGKWKMKFNINKCCIMQLSRHYHKSEFSYLMLGQVLNIVEWHFYLRVIIHHKLSWQPHVDYVCGKAMKLIGFLNWNLHWKKSWISYSCASSGNVQQVMQASYFEQIYCAYHMSFSCTFPLMYFQWLNVSWRYIMQKLWIWCSSKVNDIATANFLHFLFALYTFWLLRVLRMRHCSVNIQMVVKVLFIYCHYSYSIKSISQCTHKPRNLCKIMGISCKFYKSFNSITKDQNVTSLSTNHR